MDFTGRTVLIAGGTGNIGSGVAVELLNRGAKVIVTTRSAGRFEEMKTKIPAELLSKLSGITADVSTEEGVAAIFEQSTNQPGGVQHVIASIGSWYQGCNLVEVSLAEFNQNIKDRVTGHFLLLKAFSAYLEKQQGSTYTMVTGGAGDYYVAPGTCLIAMSSGALYGLSTAARAELKDAQMTFSEFRINCSVYPKLDSEMPTSDPYSMGHDLIAKAILATMVTRSRDRNDVGDRQEAQALAAKI